MAKSARKSALSALQLVKTESVAPVQEIESVSVGRSRVTRTGMVFSDELNKPAWENTLREVGVAASGMNWAIGDLLAYAESRWGEMYERAQEITGLEYGYLANLKMVAGSYEFSHRCENLSFSHHYAVYNRSTGERQKLLAQAEAGKWSVARLKQEVKQLTGEVSKEAPAWKRAVKGLRGSVAKVSQMKKSERVKVADQLEAWAESLRAGDEIPSID